MKFEEIHILNLNALLDITGTEAKLLEGLHIIYRHRIEEFAGCPVWELENKVDNWCLRRFIRDRIEHFGCEYRKDFFKDDNDSPNTTRDRPSLGYSSCSNGRTDSNE